jgi:D-alanyl-D-alanine carboxypeptidase
MFPSNSDLDAIEQLVASIYTDSAPGAAILLTKGGKVAYRRGIGLANLEHKLPITPDMPFRLASLTKPFTATAILILAETGQLALTDPLTRFLPDYPVSDPPITLEHLLTHTSGIRNYTELPEWWAVHRQDLSVPQLIDLFRLQPGIFMPGTRWAYCNSGYALLGAVIEKISGQGYGQFVEEHIFAPLEMRQSYYEATSTRVIPKLVSGYSKSPDGYTHPEYLSYTQVYAAGGLISNVDDLARWYVALRAGKLVSSAALQRIWTPYLLADGKSTNYGHGWMLSTYQGHQVVEHYGLLPGFANYLLALPDDDILAIVLSNDDSKINQNERLAFELATRALGEPYQAPAPVTMTREHLQRFAGQYKVQEGTVLTILHEAGCLFIQTADGQKLELRPLAPFEFFFPQIPVSRIRFAHDANQRITELEWTPRQKILTRAQKSP